ncbi:MAG: AraC family transcriptional regulator [Bacillota bacterium]|nr:AraC family transcriptional regulator [Bacillota bacterium]
MKFNEVNPNVRNIIHIERLIYTHNRPLKGGDNRIYFVVRGSMQISTGGTEYTLNSSDILYVPSAFQYTLKGESDDFELYIVNFDFSQYAYEHQNFFYPARAEFFDEESAIYDEPIEEMDFFKKPFYMKGMYNLIADFAQLYKVFAGKQILHRENSSAIMKSVLCIIAQGMITGCTNSNRRHIIDSIISYIHSHYKDSSLSNDKICESFHYHSYYINSLMKVYTGKTLHSYLDKVRVEEALKLLSLTDKSISEISFEVGFSSHDSFCYSFRRVTKTTPSKYRKCIIQYGK